MSHAQAWESEHARRPMIDQPLEPVVAFFAAYMDAAKDVSVLDIGCGQGTNSLWLSQQGFKVHGFDSSPSAVQRLLDRFTARRLNGAKAPVVTIADATKPWPYRSQAFDIAFEVRAIENLNEKEARFAYKQIGRVLKEGGVFFCLTASDRRPGRYTTCGKVRTVEDMVLADWLKAANMEIMHISREYEGTLEDWKVIAKRV